MKSLPQAPLDPLTGLSAARFGVYVHFPYCLSKCPYCDFATAVVKQIPEERYARAVQAELDLRIERMALGARTVQSIYLGGGTPSLCAPRWVQAILNAVGERLDRAAGAEATLEANPGAADAERFAAFRDAGVNRLSIGVQSFQPSTLAALGRAHDGETAARAFARAREAGFENVSMDFIYGVHGQTVEQVQADAAQAVAMAPEHLSAYALTLEPEALAEEVPLAKQLQRGEVALPPDEAVVEMAQVARETYAGGGLGRYEISNYARSGYHSRHNCLYWTGGEYLALGAGATGCVRSGEGALRYANHRSAEAYLHAVESGELPEAHRERLTRKELFEERVALGLRLCSGVDLAQVCREFEQPSAERLGRAEQLVRDGFARRAGERVALTPRGADVHSSICARLM